MDKDSGFKPSFTDNKHSQTGKIDAKQLLILAALLVAAAAGSFIGGMKYQKSHTSNPSVASGFNSNGPSGNGMGMDKNFNRGGTLGSVTAINDSSITLTDQRTSEAKTYSISSSTKITNSGSTATTADIKAGDTVMVAASSSDSTAASSILINPSFGSPNSQDGTQTQTQ
ncbi:MAG TPA: hypothetical protein VMR45_01805 [Patescibacteria group bacterium]|nr:hypothetical protein [Patescibacteria group bacterium]